MTNRIAVKQNALLEGAVLDENTGHSFREVNGEIVELKYCQYCKKWHPLADFSRCSRSKDGLQSYCRAGISQYGRNRCKKKELQTHELVSPVETNEVPAEPVEAIAKAHSKYDEIEALLASLKETEEQRDAEIAQLQAAKADLARQSKDLDHLTENDIKRVLDNNNIPPRLLFEAIAKKTNNRYRFFAVDLETGLSSPIKTQETAQPISAWCA
jgi:hypothetical protein